MPRTGKVADILQQDHPRLPLLKDSGDVEEQRAPRLADPPLEAALGERLAREPRSQDVVVRDVGHRRVGQRDDVPLD